MIKQNLRSVCSSAWLVRTGFPEGVGGAGGRDTKQVRHEQDSRNRQTWQDVTGHGVEGGVLDDTDLGDQVDDAATYHKGEHRGQIESLLRVRDLWGPSRQI